MNLSMTFCSKIYMFYCTTDDSIYSLSIKYCYMSLFMFLMSSLNKAHYFWPTFILVSSLSKNMTRKSLLLKTISYFSIFCLERKMSTKICTMNRRSTSLYSEIEWFFISEFFHIDFMYSSKVSLSSSFA